MPTESVNVFWVFGHVNQIKTMSIGNWISVVGSGISAAGLSIPAVGHPDWKVMVSAFVGAAIVALKHLLDTAPPKTQAKAEVIVDEKAHTITLDH